jgi:hypothetical protein
VHDLCHILIPKHAIVFRPAASVDDDRPNNATPAGLLAFKEQLPACCQTMEAAVRTALAKKLDGSLPAQPGTNSSWSAQLSPALWAAQMLDSCTDEAAAAAQEAARGQAGSHLLSLLCTLLKLAEAASADGTFVDELHMQVPLLLVYMPRIFRRGRGELWLLAQARCCSVLGKAAAALFSDQPQRLGLQRLAAAHVAHIFADTACSVTAAIGEQLAAMQAPGAAAAAAADVTALQRLQAPLHSQLQQLAAAALPTAQEVQAAEAADIYDRNNPAAGSLGMAAGLQWAVKMGLTAELALELQQFGDAVITQMPSDLWCNNPGCTNAAAAAELDLVAGKSSRCSSCKTSR